MVFLFFFGKIYRAVTSVQRTIMYNTPRYELEQLRVCYKGVYKALDEICHENTNVMVELETLSAQKERISNKSNFFLGRWASQ